ncbi:MAG: hypothetical protein JXR25_02695 [Pontiellaceae bacterium]|nr:hypothetical protein [Pontiellaceae bacterium]MBN2783711.1 hypothetical protein [Pontiellaceae bacterium]
MYLLKFTAVITLVFVVFSGTAGNASAQIVTNAFDAAQSYRSFSGNEGFGFGPWATGTDGGGKYISSGPPATFAIWNSIPNSSSWAVRSLNSGLSAGQTFSVQLMMNVLDPASASAPNRNAFQFLDASGNVLFSYWHQGGDNLDGHYTDAVVTDGTASGFAYDYAQLDSFAFTLNSATNYTFTDLSTGASISGTISGSISQVRFLRENRSSTPLSGGQDFKFTSLAITSEESSRARAAFDAYNAAFYSVFAAGKAHYTVSQYNPGSGANYFWGQAEEIEGAIDAYERNPSPNYLLIINNLLNGFSNDNGTYWSWNEFNDDIMWACIAYLRGYQHTGNTTYRSIAKANFDMMYARAWDSALGGGLYWRTTNAEKNAAVNGPAVIAAYYLYEALGDTGYLTKAQDIYDWQKAVLFNSSNGAVYDGIKINGTLETFATTYNQGTFVAAADLLGDVASAVLAADYTMNNMGNEGPDGYKIMFEYGPDNNNSGFNAIGMRWIAKFMMNRNYQYLYLPWLQANADAAWNVRRTTDNLSWCEWLHQTPTSYNLLSWDCISSMVALQVVPDRSDSLAPVFATQPANRVSAAGNTVDFSVLATNGMPITYQWYHDNHPIPGANDITLTRYNLEAGDEGYYWVVASNPVASAYSQVAHLHLIGNTNGILAEDSAANYSPASGFVGNQGFGFEPWVFRLAGGGNYISGDAQPMFTIWNNTASGQSTASRTFAMPLPVGSSLEVQLQFNNLDTGNRNGFQLEDAEGNSVFSYWHNGNEANSNNGWFSDDVTSTGSAVNFKYAYLQRVNYRFTLTSDTDYTFSDLATGASFSGQVSGAPITGVTFFRTNGPATPGDGQDFKFSDLIISVPSAVPSPSGIKLGNTPEGLRLDFPAASGYRYRVQQTMNLMEESWQDIGMLTGPGTGEATFIDTNAPADRAFYRTVSP